MQDDHLLRDLLLELHATGRIGNFIPDKATRIYEVLKTGGVIQARAEDEWRLTPRGISLLAKLM